MVFILEMSGAFFLIHFSVLVVDVFCFGASERFSRIRLIAGWVGASVFGTFCRTCFHASISEIAIEISLRDFLHPNQLQR